MKQMTMIALLLLSISGWPQGPMEKVDSLISSLYLKKQFNGNILIAEKGRLIYNKSFGLANERTGEKLNEHSVFELASCSKQFTAMAIVVLKDRGLLALDERIATYLPALSTYGNITVRNLLNHTGGLPDYMQLMDSLWDKTKIAANKDVLQMLAMHTPKALFAPNTKFEYSNTGYVILASIVEKVSGKSYADFLSTQIFKPLNMKHSFVYNRRLRPRSVKNYAFGYVYVAAEDRYVLPDDYAKTNFVFWLDGIVGDGAVNSTVIDLLRWDRALHSNKFLSKKSMDEIFTNGVLADGSLGKHGFGWRVIQDVEAGKIARHSGAWPGYITYIERNLDHDKTVIILQNHSNVMLPSDEIRSILFGVNK